MGWIITLPDAWATTGRKCKTTPISCMVLYNNHWNIVALLPTFGSTGLYGRTIVLYNGTLVLSDALQCNISIFFGSICNSCYLLLFGRNVLT